MARGTSNPSHNSEFCRAIYLELFCSLRLIVTANDLVRSDFCSRKLAIGIENQIEVRINRQLSLQQTSKMSR
jgi:hypothetical protein